MGYYVSIFIAAAIIASAAWILIRRALSFKRTCGRSACENCPYSGSCGQKNK